MFQKIIVIGSPGAGKSTFARKLKDRTGLPLYYLDMLWHRPDKSAVSTREFDRKLEKILLEHRWIIDGNYSRTLELRLNYCDTVFLLDLPVDICLLGAESRVGKQREDLPWLEMELDQEFRQYIIDFPQKNLPQIYKLVEKYRNDKNVIILKSREEAEAYLKRMA